jgi:hypothetical protein
MDNHELLLVEQYAIGQAQLGDLALRPAGPGTEISDRDR